MRRPGAALQTLRERWRALPPIPTMDEAWTPNDDLSHAEVFQTFSGLVDAVALGTGRLAVIAGDEVIILDANGVESSSIRLPAQGTVGVVHEGRLLVACVGLGVVRVDVVDGTVAEMPATREMRCITAMAVRKNVMWVAEGASAGTAPDWQRDLMRWGASGRLWRLDLAADSVELIADGLSWPSGLAIDGTDVVLSEAWRHRLVRVSPSGAVSVVLADLPAYPGQVTARAGGGWMLALFAPRSALVELIRRDREYCEKMLTELEPEAWVAPTLRTRGVPVEQVQGGQLLVFGRIKPWAPSRSYGLMAQLSADWSPVRTWHSRADGDKHGITRCLDFDGRLLAVAAGPAELLEVKQ